MLEAQYREAVARRELKSDPAQARAIARLNALAKALGKPRGFSLFRKTLSFFGRPSPAGAPRGLYIWGDVGRGKTLLMDFFFEEAAVAKKRRAHFNSFMVDVHARIHAERRKAGSDDPIPPVAKALAAEARLLCFDEFQVTDVADAMILGRLFGQLFAQGVVIVATSNTPPDRLYEGGLNRQLFLPFIAEIQQRLEVVELNGPVDYRLQRLSGVRVYITPLGPGADAAMDQAWLRLTDTHFFDGAPARAFARGKPMALTVLGRQLAVPQGSRGAARFSFAQLCDQPLAAADYLAIAQNFHTLLIDHIPVMGENMHDVARRFTLLIDTLYDEGVKLVCSAAAPPDALFTSGVNADAFRRTASRLAEMQSEDYLRRGHGIHGLTA
ncbi:MAG TPA: cell division protein ZapE [Rhizomicrobium sp.]|nr:cell division protein ZapE [Rhizomicrobium sp.]